MILKALCVFLISLNAVLGTQTIGEKFSSSEIGRMISDFKKDERGPYQAIRWFCLDGTILMPKERCAEPGGIQHALPKESVKNLAQKNAIYLGQILAGTDFEQFWDSANGNSRLKQYMLEQYLQSVDNGWIMRKGRYYRGAIQAEDEADWGYRFLLWLVANDENLKKNYFLVRQAARIIPHNAADQLWERIRSVSKVLSDSMVTFTDIRVKLHGQPEAADLEKVRLFRKQNISRIKESWVDEFDQLEKDLVEAFKPVNTESLEQFAKLIPANSTLHDKLSQLIGKINKNTIQGSEQAQKISELLMECRMHLTEFKQAKHRLALIDLSVTLESLLFRFIQSWQPENLYGLFKKAYAITHAATGCGYLEIWEFENIKPHIQTDSTENQLSLLQMQQKTEYIKRAVEWGSGMVRAFYKEPVALFSEFEPLAEGFIDDRIRVSILLPSGLVAGQLSDIYANYAGVKNNMLKIASQNQIRGLNSGFAAGELVAIESLSENMEFDADKIYLLAQPPSDLKPVAGLLTVSEGNLVSHVQLLARNLGIPNAVLTSQAFNELKTFAGQDVFYAVSPKGSVLMKPVEQMNSAEKDLFKKVAVRDEKFHVPTDKINLDRTEIMDLRDLRATDSGSLSGPKAANLGKLKHLFDENVVEGFALPFGIYRQHLEQKMPGQHITYWQFLSSIFAKLANMRETGSTEKESEDYILQQLAILRAAIKQIPLLEEFKKNIHNAFTEILGKPLGQIPVFIRSDTNMEDLKDFTGAGLNLTVFNVKDEKDIWQGIRDVWASPFSERSYRWRQRLLLNPENVYPSILIIPSVDNDKSGVMITTGIFSGNREDITVAFNRGSGGAVEGQVAESYTIQSDNQSLILSPGRELRYISIPQSGGVKKAITSLEQPILDKTDLENLASFSVLIKNRMIGKKGFEKSVPLDIELGIKDGKIWLFQVRPFVESKKALSSVYLNDLDIKINPAMMISLQDAI